MASEFRVDGALLTNLSYCDLYGMDIPDIKSYLQGKGYPCIIISYDYLLGSIESQRSAIETFVQMLKK